LSKPSRISTMSSGKRPAARPSWITPSRYWLLFLKYLDGLEQDRADEAALGGKKYAFILQRQYRWDGWAAPKGRDGKLDHNKAQTGDDLCDFVNQKLFPYLTGSR
jgi:type I restriction enzyme M protein